jgi:hypothetical protein
VDSVTYNGGGYLLQEGSSNPQLALHDVLINHVTAVGPGVKGMLVVGNDLTNPVMNNFSWTNNIFLSGSSGVLSTGGGSVNCAFHPGGAVAILTACYNPYVFSSNAVVGAVGSWPTGTFMPATASTVSFVNYNNGNGGSYMLQPSSPYKNAGLDGKDLGADINAVMAAIAGVQ